MCENNIVDTTHGRKLAKKVRLTNIKTGEVRIFDSQSAACRELNLHSWGLKQVVLGKASHAKGWYVEMLDEIAKSEWDRLDKHTTSYKRKCQICNTVFWVKKKKNGKFCSIKCCREYFSVYAKNGMLQRDLMNRLLCYKCLKYKEEDEFYYQAGSFFVKTRNSRSSRCISCQNELGRNYRSRNKNNLNFILRSRFTTAKTTSKARKIYFDSSLKWEDLLDIYTQQNGVCPISKQILALNRDKTPYTISLDRKDSTIGYVKENVHLVCWAVNQMKNNFSLDELFKWCSFILSANKQECLPAVNN